MARPLDPRRFEHKAVLALMPAGALLGALLAWMERLPVVQVLQQAVIFLLVVYGSWVLAREMDPDNPISAFIGMAVCILAAMAVESQGLLVAFTTLALVRMANRSSGLEFRKSDSIITLVFVLLVMYSTGSPLYGVVAGAAFILDGSLREPLRRQWLFALFCFGGTVVYVVDHHWGFSQLVPPGSLFAWVALLFLLIFALNTALLKTVRSTSDAEGKPLDAGRVRAGMWVGLFAALQGIARPGEVVILVGVIAGISLGMAFRKGFKPPATV